MAIRHEVKTFDQLNTKELYDLLQLRSEVFVVEQNCIYQDIDGKDEIALHILQYEEERLVGYSRAFKPGDYFMESSFGRVVVKANARQKGYGNALVVATEQAIQ